MDWIIPNAVWYIVVPAICYLFLCRYCRMEPRWYLGAAYVAVYAAVLRLELKMQLSQILCFPLDILILSAFGSVHLKKNCLKPFAMSVFVISVSNVCGGMVQFIVRWAVESLSPEYLIALKYADMAAGIITVVLAAGALSLAYAFLSDSLAKANGLSLFLLSIPVFFISLTEKMISEKIYGDTLVWDSGLGIVFPVINHTEILLLQAAACICLCAVVFSMKKIVGAISAEERLGLLEQQAKVQENYIREAGARYEMTRSFRHDIKNHLIVLERLLQADETKKACRYLENLGQASDALTYPVSTGNTAVDVLLGSKFSIAAQEGIKVECEMKIPPSGKIGDLDWCILLSNAIDNAIRANSLVEQADRYIRVSGRQKGNFYLLDIVNPCGKERKGIPKDGTGVSNMRAVAEKYGGTVEINVADGVFKLDVLFLISQQ